jgi:dienelactone hydrolase
MAEIVVFHHALGLTEDVVSFAAALRAAGHTVHTPDLYAGRTFESLEDGARARVPWPIELVHVRRAYATMRA